MTKAINLGVVVAGLLLLVAEAGDSAEKYPSIADRNVFRLSPPKPEAKLATVQPEPPQISLQGVTRILGLRQALLKIQTKTKSATADESCIIGERQSRNGVMVQRIDVDSGTVWLTNQGEEQVLTLQR